MLWDQGTTKLRDYRTQRDEKSGRPRVLVIPSLVNRYYVLDLEQQAQRSCAGWTRNGFDPFVVDWDGPGYLERSFSLTDYIAGRLEGAPAGGEARAGRADLPHRLLHGRQSGAGPGPAQAGGDRRPHLPGDTLGFPRRECRHMRR